MLTIKLNNTGSLNKYEFLKATNKRISGNYGNNWLD